MPKQQIPEWPEDRVEDLAERGRRVVQADRYVVVVVLLIAVILANALLVQHTLGLLLMVALLAGTLAVTLATSNASRRTVLLSCAIPVASLVAGAAAQVIGQVGDARLGYQFAVIAMGIVIAVVIARRISQHPQVSVDTVAGAAAIYLLFGLVFAVLFAFIGDIQIVFGPHLAADAGTAATAAQTFFVSARPPVSSDFLYYSFTTLTTVGYGDLTAATQFGRMLSVCEALLGQLYLVTVVAILVSNLRGGAKKAAVA